MSDKPTLPRLMSVFLVTSYAYYRRYVSLLKDETYDKIAKTLHDHWDELEHPHKHLVTKEDLAAGTLYALRDYPRIVKHCAEDKIRAHEVKEQKRIYERDSATHAGGADKAVDVPDDRLGCEEDSLQPERPAGQERND